MGLHVQWEEQGGSLCTGKVFSLQIPVKFPNSVPF